MENSTSTKEVIQNEISTNLISPAVPEDWMKRIFNGANLNEAVVTSVS